MTDCRLYTLTDVANETGRKLATLQGRKARLKIKGVGLVKVGKTRRATFTKEQIDLILNFEPRGGEHFDRGSYVKAYRKKRREERKNAKRCREIQRNGYFYISVKSEENGLYYVKKVGLSKSEARGIAVELNAVGVPAHYRPHISERMKIKWGLEKRI